MSANLRSNIATHDSCTIVCNAKAPGLADKIYTTPTLGTSFLDPTKDADLINKSKAMLFEVTKSSCMTMCMSKPLNQFNFSDLENAYLLPTATNPTSTATVATKKHSPTKKRTISSEKKRVHKKAASPQKKKAASPQKKKASPLKEFNKKAKASFKNMADSIKMAFQVPSDE